MGAIFWWRTGAADRCWQRQVGGPPPLASKIEIYRIVEPLYPTIRDPSGIRSDAMREVTASAGPIGLCDDPKGAQQVSTGAPSCCKAFRSVYQKNSGISGPYYTLLLPPPRRATYP